MSQPATVTVKDAIEVAYVTAAKHALMAQVLEKHNLDMSVPAQAEQAVVVHTTIWSKVRSSVYGVLADRTSFWDETFVTKLAETVVTDIINANPGLLQSKLQMKSREGSQGMFGNPAVH